MKNKIINQVKNGNGAVHLLSIVEREIDQSIVFNSRCSEMLKTRELILDPFYKSSL